MSQANVRTDEPRIETDSAGRRIWRVGNLVYTRAGLVMLFIWLLWIDFTFTLMEKVFGPILQFKLSNDLHCDPWLFNVLMATAPTTLSLALTPIISIKSDRHRGPRGRRIPYLLYPTPVVCALLALMGYGNEIAAWLHAHLFAGMPSATVAIWTFGILLLVFTIANTYLGAVFYYLFNDVVPREYIVTFFGYFRAVGTLAGMVYAYFIYGYSDKSGPLHFWFVHIEHILVSQADPGGDGGLLPVRLFAGLPVCQRARVSTSAAAGQRPGADRADNLDNRDAVQGMLQPSVLRAVLLRDDGGMDELPDRPVL